MSQNRGASSSTPLPQPKFDLATILHFIFSTDVVNSYLVSTDPTPPTAISPEMINSSITMDSLLTPDPDTAALVLVRSKKGSFEADDDDSADGVVGRDGSISTSSRESIKKNVAPPATERMTYVCHGGNDQFCLITQTDDRTPLAFLEKPAPLVPGLRRVACLKVDENIMPYAHLHITYYWLQDGRSSMAIFCYTLEPVVYSEKYFLLLRQYPPSRYPSISDVIETLIAFDEVMCSFCTWRGLIRCQCATKMYERLTPPPPGRDQRDPWSLHMWSWLHHETGFKRYQLLVKNIPSNISHTTTSFHQSAGALGKQKMHLKGFEYYLNMLAPFFSRQMISSSSFAPLRAQIPKQKMLMNEVNDYSVPGRSPILLGTAKESKANLEHIMTDRPQATTPASVEYTMSQSRKRLRVDENNSPHRILSSELQHHPPQKSHKSNFDELLSQYNPLGQSNPSRYDQQQQHFESVSQDLDFATPGVLDMETISVACIQPVENHYAPASPSEPGMEPMATAYPASSQDQYGSALRDVHPMEAMAAAYTMPRNQSPYDPSTPHARNNSRFIPAAPADPGTEAMATHYTSPSQSLYKSASPSASQANPPSQYAGAFVVSNDAAGPSEVEKALILAYLEELETMEWPSNVHVSCRFCERQFLRKHEIRRHIKANHLKERAFTCDVCQMQFVRKSHLDVHKRGYHEKESALVCRYCEKSFRFDSSRYKHMNSVHPEQMERDRKNKGK